MIDPTKETQGLSEKVRNGFVTWDDVIRQLGGDPDSVAERIKANNELFDKYGFVLACDPRHETSQQRGDPAGDTGQADQGDQVNKTTKTGSQSNKK